MTMSLDLPAARSRPGRLALAGLGIAVLLALPFILGGYFLFIASLVLVYVLAAFGTNLLTGYTNLISLAGAVFFGIGAYGAAILTGEYGVTLLVAALAAGLVAMVVGLLLAIPLLRLEEVFLAMATLGFVMIFAEIAKSGGELTGGENGMGVAAPDLFGLELGGAGTYWMLLAVVAVLMWMGANFGASRWGRALKAVKGSESAARIMGLDTARLKIVAFALSSFYCGVAGALYGPLIRFIDPSTFDLMVSISFVSMVIVGGLGSIRGSILGATFVIAVPQCLTYLGLDQVQRSVYGLAMILSLMFLPGGLSGLGHTLFRRHRP